MDSETHRLVTEYALTLLVAEAASAHEPLPLAQVPNEYIEHVVSVTAELDRMWRGGHVHHMSDPTKIFEKLQFVRREVLKGKLSSYGASTLGTALHSLQDTCVPPSKLKGLHAKVEREARKLQGSLHQVHVELPKPVGCSALWWLLLQQNYSESGSEALKCALAYTFAALYAVFANPREAPDHLLAEARKLRTTFSGWRLALYLFFALAAIALYASLALTALLRDLSLLAGFLALFSPLFLLPAFGALGTLTRDLDAFVRNLHRVANLAHASSFAALPVLLPALTALLPQPPTSPLSSAPSPSPYFTSP